MLVHFKRSVCWLFGYLATLCINIDAKPNLKIKKLENISFITHTSGELLLDVLRPNDTKQRPAVLCLHGGFWAKGSKKFMHPLAEGLVEKGYVAVCSNYRLTDVAPAPAQLHDVFSAIRFLRENASDYGIDPGMIGVTGSSAGGYLAVMAAVFDSGDKRTRPNAAVGMGAQTDLTSPHIQNSIVLNWSKFMGGFYRQVPENYLKQSPLNHLTLDDPPVAIICGEHDKPSTRANTFRQKALQLGVPTSLTEISGAPMGYLRLPSTGELQSTLLTNFLEFI
jgi:pectinesterase